MNLHVVLACLASKKKQAAIDRRIRFCYNRLASIIEIGSTSSDGLSFISIFANDC